MNEIKKFGMGWIPDYPDFRDYTVKHDELSLKHKQLGQKESVKVMLGKAGVFELASLETLPTEVDHSKYCSEINNQLKLGSCTAQACVGMVEYFERKTFGKYIDASPLFLYKATRNLMHRVGDTGAAPRKAISALALFGVPPEEFWTYTDEDPDFDKEPPAFCYAYAQNYQAIQYVRLDTPDTSKDELLNRIKTNLAAGLPSSFGFIVFPSYKQAESNGKIPYPWSMEGEPEGGHSVVAIGYDDKIKIKNSFCDIETEGALLIKNSWGIEWGKEGYGWLPYEYVLKGLAIDWWLLLKNEWIDTEVFKLEE